MRYSMLALALTLFALLVPVARCEVSITCFSEPLDRVAIVVNASSGVIIGSYSASSIPLEPSPNLVAIVATSNGTIVANLSSREVEVCSSKPTTFARIASIPVSVPGYLWIGSAQISLSLPSNVSLYGVRASLCLPLSPFVGSRLYVLENLTVDGRRASGSCIALAPGNHTVIATYAAQLDLASPYVAIPSATVVAAIVIAAIYGFLARRSSVARY